MNDKDITERCEQAALAIGATYFGVQWGIQCFAGSPNATRLTKYGKQLSDSECRMNCGSNDNSASVSSSTEKKCGNGWKSIIYQLPKPLSKRIGCFQDGPNRLIDYSSIQLNVPRAFGICEQAAILAGVKYFGIHGGIYCVYGNLKDISSLNRYGKQLDDSECRMSCGSSDKSQATFDSFGQKCGGDFKIVVYSLL